MSENPPQRFTVSCPCCDAELRVDAENGAVLSHSQAPEPIASGKDFDELFAEVDRGKARAEARFAKEQAAYNDRKRLLEAKFEDALDRVDAADNGKPPPSPFDLD